MKKSMTLAVNGASHRLVVYPDEPLATGVRARLLPLTPRSLRAAAPD